ncbi:unnamed protein product [Moneuplotes crassus]|uniref:E2F/DP family winged-helix DNA-binding domain-containing protein n=1 Tax=Euplotes crassus TaxID=5936 RepID=A0AAD1U9F8_EUPCR|nr:unnamed protein product [Moneuplotes crassus]
MIETSKTNTSSFLIALDPQEGQDSIRTFTQEERDIRVPLMKSNSAVVKGSHLNLISENLQREESNDEIERSSILEESYSCLTQNDPRFSMAAPYEKARKTSKRYNRKEKSLGELCKKFIYLYGAKQYCIIALDECTFTLGVERRRIYDIINILESFNVLSRLAKNKYEWRGIDQIENSIRRMRGCSLDDLTAPPVKRRKKKSLGILCESFIKQFLTWRETISLDQAARRISDDQIDESKLKTKVRRLYDIANVLAALNLIEKTSLETRKPAFKWVGETGLRTFISEMEQYFGESSILMEPASTKKELMSNEVVEPRLKSSETRLEKRQNREFNRINSDSTSLSFKNVGPIKEVNLAFCNLNAKNIESSLSEPQEEILAKNLAKDDLTLQLVGMLDKLSVTKPTHPVYKPTPMYPINHFLENSCVELRTTVLDKICEDLLEKYKENKLNISFEPEYKTPAFNKFQSERFDSSTTLASEHPNYGSKANREEVGKALKMKWTQNMKEFGLSCTKGLLSERPNPSSHLG